MGRAPHFLALALAVAIVACGSPTRPSTPVTVTLAPGESRQVSRETTVRFVGVVSDSRCPLNALCVQAGDVVVDIELTVAGWAATAQLALGDAARTTAVHRGVHVTLTDVQPYPVAGDGPPVDPAQYRATVDVTWD